jgi:hypothetical protein
VTLWALLLVVTGIGLCVYGANTSLNAKLAEHPVPARHGKISAATGRLALRTGAVLLLVGGFLFVVGIVIHTIIVLFTLLLVAAVVAVLLGAWGWVRRPGSR